MTHFTFRQVVRNSLFVYEYVGDEEGLFQKAWEGRGATLGGEDVALYLGFIWRITSGLKRYAVPAYHRDSAIAAVGAPYALVDWEYAKEAAEPQDQGPSLVRARSSVRQLPTPAPLWEIENANRAGLFEVRQFAQLRDLLQALLHDATAELNIFALHGDGVHLASVLRRREQPRLSDCLQEKDVFINLVVGMDQDELDSVTVYARRDIGGEISELTREYESAVRAYEHDVDRIENVRDYDDRIMQLLGLHE